MLLVPRSTSTSSATSVTASTAGYGGWAGGDHTMGGGAWQHGTREHIYIYIYIDSPLFFLAALWLCTSIFSLPQEIS